MTDRTLTSKYPGACRTCGAPMPAGTTILWSKDAGPRHASMAACAAGKAAYAARYAEARAAQAPEPSPFDPSPLAAFLNGAAARGLKFPKARFLAPDGRAEMRLSVGTARSKAPGAINVVIGDQWQGRLTVAGMVEGPSMTAELLATVARIAEAPAVAAKTYAALTSRCSFCGLALTDAGSVEVGYGPICAARYGLPHTAKGTAALDLADLDAAPAEAAWPLLDAGTWAPADGLSYDD